MKYYTLRPLALAAAVLATMSALPAAAQSLSMTGDGKLDDRTLKFGNETPNVRSMGSFEVKDSSNNEFWVYCLDPLTGFSTAQPYSTMPLSTWLLSNGTANNGYDALFDTSRYTNDTIDNGRAAGGYFDRNTATVLNKLTELYQHAYNDSLTSNLKSAAFQYAIWEIEGDTGYSASTAAGGLEYTGGNATFASQVGNYLTALNTGNWAAIGLAAVTNFTFTVYQPGVGSSQVLLSAKPSGVPEPSTLALALLGVVGAASLGRRKAA